jgi:hypothetical protein
MPDDVKSIMIYTHVKVLISDTSHRNISVIITHDRWVVEKVKERVVGVRFQISNSDSATAFESNRKVKQTPSINMGVNEDPWSDDEVGNLKFMQPYVNLTIL